MSWQRRRPRQTAERAYVCERRRVDGVPCDQSATAAREHRNDPVQLWPPRRLLIHCGCAANRARDQRANDRRHLRSLGSVASTVDRNQSPRLSLRVYDAEPTGDGAAPRSCGRAGCVATIPRPKSDSSRTSGNEFRQVGRPFACQWSALSRPLMYRGAISVSTVGAARSHQAQSHRSGASQVAPSSAWRSFSALNARL
jgi:hypothetical protein